MSAPIVARVPAVLYSARVVCPMAGPPLPDGGVLVSGGQVVAVGPRRGLRGRASREHRVDGVLLPGLVDGHSRVEHADAAHLAVAGPHAAWRRAVAGTTAAWPSQRWGRSAQRGVHGLLRAGVTLAADVVRRGPGVPALARAGVLGDSLVEIGDVDRTEQDAVLAALEHALARPAGARRVGIAVASLTSLGTGVVQALASLAQARGVAFHVPAAETSAEVTALRSGEGPPAQDAAGRDFEWLQGGAGVSPVGYLAQLGALWPGCVLVHGVWVEPGDARVMAAAGVAVVCCPRANAALGMGEAPLELYAEAGVALALGSEGPAATGAADVLAEVAAWAALARRRGLAYWPGPSGPVSLEEQAVRLATVDGARALRWAGAGGTLEPGQRADLVGVAVPAGGGSVWEDLVAHGAGSVVLTVLGGVIKARRDGPDRAWPELAEHLALEEPRAS